MGGLLPTAKLGKNNGITPKSVGFEFIQIQNSYIKISMSSLYNSLTLAVSMYAGGEVGLFLLSIALSRKTESKCALIGNKRGTKFYVRDKFLYISTTDTTNSHYSITSFSLASQIESVESIPRQEFDDSYYELTVTPIV